MHARFWVILAALALATAVLVGATTVSADGGGPPLSVPAGTLAAALSCPGGFTHPEHEPVLLVHGTGATAEQNWGWNYAPALPQLGFDTCTVTLPGRAMGDIQISSEYVVAAIRAIASASGRQVDVLGHSQGGLQPRWALRWWPDLTALVDDVVTLGTPHHGTIAVNLLPPAFCPQACKQMQPGSKFLTALNSGDETPGPVSYTSIASQFDELVQPQPSASALDGGSNVMVQDFCLGRPVDHVGLAGDAVSFELVIDAFTHPGPADPARFPSGVCSKAAFKGVDYLGVLAPAMFNLGGFTFASMGPEPALAPYTQQS